MKLLFAAIIIFIITGCKDNIVNHYIEVPKTDTIKVKCDDGEHGHKHHKHHKHLRDREED